MKSEKGERKQKKKRACRRIGSSVIILQYNIFNNHLYRLQSICEKRSFFVLQGANSKSLFHKSTRGTVKNLKGKQTSDDKKMQ